MLLLAVVCKYVKAATSNNVVWRAGRKLMCAVRMIWLVFSWFLYLLVNAWSEMRDWQAKFEKKQNRIWVFHSLFCLVQHRIWTKTNTKNNFLVIIKALGVSPSVPSVSNNAQASKGIGRSSQIEPLLLGKLEVWSVRAASSETLTLWVFELTKFVITTLKLYNVNNKSDQSLVIIWKRRENPFQWT